MTLTEEFTEIANRLRPAFDNVLQEGTSEWGFVVVKDARRMVEIFKTPDGKWHMDFWQLGFKAHHHPAWETKVDTMDDVVSAVTEWLKRA